MVSKKAWVGEWIFEGEIGEGGLYVWRRGTESGVVGGMER